MKFKVGDRVRYDREFLVDTIQTGDDLCYTGIEGFEIIQTSGEEVRSEDGIWFHEGHLELVPEEPEFEEGEMIEVSDDGKEWERRIFLYYIPNVPDKYLCVHKNCEDVYLQGGDRYDYQAWLYARKLSPQLTRKEIAEKFGVRILLW